MCIDKKQIAFITCVSDEAEYAECLYYLSKLYVPEGYETDVISIREAPSMAAGYNAGMESSPAKYKVYLHQDVFIKNRDFISDMLKVFHCDAQIGILGMIGKRNREIQADALMKWDTGKVLDNTRGFWDFSCPSREDIFAEVWAVDGLLLATQYDVMWREDLFDGWDLYDISQCMEFIRKGYKIVVPYQEGSWCFHDALYPKLTKYFDYHKLFLKEYFGNDIYSHLIDGTGVFSYERGNEFAQAIEDMRDGMKTLIEMEDRANLRVFLEDLTGLKDQTYMREYAAIVHIDCLEETAQSKQRFWESGMSLEQLLKKLRHLKYGLKRLEYDAEDPNVEWDWGRYTKYAILDVCDRYVLDKDKVLEKMGEKDLIAL
ncbi:MAG: hypothetical protein HFG22_07995 [Lachnospiraceae bacterium]|nr:hypothetical protein [Lachnospiraceae bacterium]